MLLFKDFFAVPQVLEQQDCIFQQDGAPPHWGIEVREFLSETFGEQWIGRDGPMKWPPRSPDLTPLDFFFWGFVKDIVYQSKVADIRDLVARIKAASQEISLDVLEKVWKKLKNRLELLETVCGGHLENLKVQ